MVLREKGIQIDGCPFFSQILYMICFDCIESSRITVVNRICHIISYRSVYQVNWFAYSAVLLP